MLVVAVRKLLLQPRPLLLPVLHPLLMLLLRLLSNNPHNDLRSFIQRQGLHLAFFMDKKCESLTWSNYWMIFLCIIF